MKEIIKDIKQEYQKNHNRYNNINLFNKIKQQAINNHQGFGPNRSMIYTYLFKLNEENISHTAIKLTSSCEFKYIKTKILPDGLTTTIENSNGNKVSNEKDPHENIDILKKDLPRCIYHHILNHLALMHPFIFDEFAQCITHLLLSRDLDYCFYQGYLDICVYMFTIFPKEKQTKYNPYTKAIASINRITELLVKDYITLSQHNEAFNQTVHFLSDLIGLQNKDIGAKLRKDNCSICLILSWVLTLMTHDANDPGRIYRLLDYLIVAPPYAIYVFSSLIAFDLISQGINLQRKINERKRSIDSQTSQGENEKYFHYLSGIVLEDFDFNKYIQKTNDFIDKNADDIKTIRMKYSKSLKSICNVNYNGIVDFLIPSQRKKRSIIIRNSFIIAAFIVLIISFIIYSFPNNRLGIFKHSIVNRINMVQ